jgi:acyl-coenzyme A thioesterase PaaI-like protein
MTLRGNHIYDHLGVQSKRIDSQSGQTRMPINDDVRVDGGLRAAPLGLAFEQGVASYLFDRVMVVPTQISLHIRDDGAGVKGIISTTRLARLGRTIVIVEGSIVDDEEPSRLLAYGSIAWSVIGEGHGLRPESTTEPLPAAGVNVIVAAAITPLADGSGCRVDGIVPQTTGPGGILHAGILQLLSEEAALVVTRRATPTHKVRAVDCTYNFIQPGKVGPFVATAEIVCDGEEGLDTKTVVRDAGNNDRMLALAYIRVRQVE